MGQKPALLVAFETKLSVTVAIFTKPGNHAGVVGPPKVT